MYKKKLAQDIRCPLEYGLVVFGGRWKSRIICVLAHRGRLRYNALRDEMINITDAMLSENLKTLQEHGIVLREDFQEIPPHVEYSLTGKGQSIVPVLQAICHWAGANNKEFSVPDCGLCSTCDFTRDQ